MALSLASLSVVVGACTGPGAPKTTGGAEAQLQTSASNAGPAAVPGEGEGEVADADPASAPPAPRPRFAVLDAKIRAARSSAQRRMLRAEDPLQPDLAELPEDGGWPGANQPRPPEGLPGMFAPLEFDDDHRALASFETALAQLEAGTRTAPVRIALYGASGVAADLWTAYVRAYLQARFGDGGPGIVAAVPPHKWSRHNELDVEASKHWHLHNAWRLEDVAPPGRFGVMGEALSTADGRAWTQLRPRTDASAANSLAFYELDYLVQHGGGRFDIFLDGEPVTTISTALEPGLESGLESGPKSPLDSGLGRGLAKARLGRHRIDLEPGRPHTLRVQVVGDGQVRLLGVVAETGAPGIVLDTLGVNGAKPENLLRWDSLLWSEHLALREPSLYVLAYGNNESVDVDVPIAEYERGYRQVLERFRVAVPEAACLMIGPGDYPVVDHGELRPRPRLAKIRGVQRALAPEFGCAYLDTLTVFGGPGSKRVWVDAGLGKDDYLHLTRAGHLRFGMAVGDALMQGYDWRAAVQAPQP